MRESSQNRPRRQEPDQSLSGRLDELTPTEMERVLERAIRIHAERSEAHTFTRRQIDEVAAELGLPRSVVERAIEEELTAPASPDPEERRNLLGPHRLVARTTVDGPGSEVEDRVVMWMESEEGLRPAARVAGGVRWIPDSHWTTGARLALGSEGTKALRGMRETTHRITPVDEDRHLVELDVDTSAVRVGAGWTAAGVGVTGIAGGGVAAVALAGGNDLGQFLTVAAPMVTAGVAAAVTVGRVWTSSVRKGMERMLDGVAHPELYPRAGRRREKRRAAGKGRSGMERLVDEVSDALDRLLD